MKQKRSWIVALVLALVLAQLPWNSRPAQALTYTVTNTNDSGVGSLRQAMINANTNTGADTIQFSIPMSDLGCNAGTGVCTIQPSNALPALTDDGTTIDGYTQTGAAPATDTMTATLKIVIDGTNAGIGVSGLTVNSDNNTIRGLVIHNFDYHGISIGLNSAAGNTVEGNYIGTDVTGTTDLGNGESGVYLYGGGQYNTVGGGTAAERNVISGNDAAGVRISASDTMSNTVSANYIGLAADGTSSLGNHYGIFIQQANNNIIGGNTAGERNIISGNDYGVFITSGGGGSIVSNNIVSGNYIGTDAGGTVAVGNAYNGVYISEEAQNNIVGGDTVGERNVISGNGWYGVEISWPDTMSNTVLGNYIGTDASGALDLGNALGGVYIDDSAQNNTVGPDNLIAHNDGDGVEVSGASTTGNTITQNSIFSNTMGIDLVSGANGGILPPTIITTTQGSVNIVGTACPGCTVEVFRNGDTDGEGETYIGDTTATAGGAFTLTVSSLSNPYLTATATDAISGTSEFSAVFTSTVTGGGNVYLPIILRNH